MMRNNVDFPQPEVANQGQKLASQDVKRNIAERRCSAEAFRNRGNFHSRHEKTVAPRQPRTAAPRRSRAKDA